MKKHIKNLFTFLLVLTLILSVNIKANASDTSDKIPMYGRLYIPDININVGLYNTISTEAMNEEDSAILYSLTAYPGTIIRDSKTQAFETLKDAEIGAEAYIEKVHGRIINMKCVEKLKGYDKGAGGIVDLNEESVHGRADYLIYAHSDNSDEPVDICLWDIVEQESENAPYYGELYIDDVNIHVPLYYGISQDTIDRKDCAGISTWMSYPGELILDHNDQAFENLHLVESGMEARIELPDGNTIHMRCTDAFDGYNRGTDITDTEYNVVNGTSDYMMCTCKDEGGWNIRICRWEKILKTPTITTAKYVHKTPYYGTSKRLEIAWNKVDNAESYEVLITKADGKTIEYTTVNNLIYDKEADCPRVYIEDESLWASASVKVRAVCDDVYSDWSESQQIGCDMLHQKEDDAKNPTEDNEEITTEQEETTTPERPEESTEDNNETEDTDKEILVGNGNIVIVIKRTLLKFTSIFTKLFRFNWR